MYGCADDSCEMAATLPAPAAGGGVPVSESMLQGEWEALACELQGCIEELLFAEAPFILCTPLSMLVVVVFLSIDCVVSTCLVMDCSFACTVLFRT